ncbi:MAG TPA: rhamnan synthesis F family protein [Nitrosospira sp.]|nr:rhamnan synthesis F family protein [Nitrosospira sp.]
MKKFIKWPIRAIKRDMRYFRDLSLYLMSREQTDEKPYVRYCKTGSISPSFKRPVCFFSTYDSEGIVRPNVIHYLGQLVHAGFDIVFISSSDTISNDDLGKLSNYCIKIINRVNRGYDFYSWKTGLEKYPHFHEHAAVLLANDSVIGPLFNISGIIEKLEANRADVLGMTDCYQFHPHLQSYFLYCKKHVAISKEFNRFFSCIDVFEFKMAIIRKYEVGFSRLLQRRFKLSALYNLETILNQASYSARPKKWIDPTFHLWKPLITELNFPFIKKSLVTKWGISIEEISATLAGSHASHRIDIDGNII